MTGWLRHSWASSGVVVAVMTALVLVAGASQLPQVSGPPERPIVLQTERGQRIRVVPIASGLTHPWSIAFLPDDRTMLVTERPGRLRIIRDGVLDPRPVPGLPVIDTSYIAGLHEVALHPEFAQNHLIYLSYSKSDERGITVALARGRFDGTALTDVRDIFVADAWQHARPGNPHTGTYSGRIVFGPDHMLYLAVADRDTLSTTSNPEVRLLAQSLSSDAGKVLRLRDDGTIPDDNPFVGRPGVKPEIYTYGHRNQYGLAFHPQTGALWESEIGPLGGDEINILLPGRNYGWPLVSLGREYDGTAVSDQPWWRPDIEMPVFFWVPAISPSGMVFYTGDRFPNWKGNLFVSALGKQLQRLTFNAKGLLVGKPEQLLLQINQRLRDVRQGRDGCLYVLTEGRIMGDDTLGAVLRIEPADES
jgi:glucose/arabinose dehydrogenase